GLVGIPSFSLGGYAFASATSTYYLVWGVAAALVIVLATLARSGYGRALRATRADQTAARALGIQVPRYKVSVFLISAALAALAGSLYAFHFHFLSPEMVGTSRSLEMITMLVLGGEGTLAGPLIGVALLTLLPAAFQPLATYKTLAEVLAIADVSFSVREGSLTAAIGPNGAGKTTLFNLVTNLYPPDAGSASCFGIDLTGHPPDTVAALGLVRTFQTARAFPGMTVLENVLVGAHLRVRARAWQQALWLRAVRDEERAIR